MCILAWDWQPGSEIPLLLIGNRDEYYARPAQALDWWKGDQILAGKDLQAGGTWLGVSRQGRLAALTNYRLPVIDTAPRPSRGELTTRFLQGDASPEQYLSALALEADRYNPFNLLVWDGEILLGFESRHRKIVTLSPGISAVSNADFDTPWPKVQRLKGGLQQLRQAGHISKADLLALLQDRKQAVDPELPRTGISLEMERLLSATFITSTSYGTRASSIVQMGANSVRFLEQSYGETSLLTTTAHDFAVGTPRMRLV